MSRIKRGQEPTVAPDNIKSKGPVIPMSSKKTNFTIFTDRQIQRIWFIYKRVHQSDRKSLSLPFSSGSDGYKATDDLKHCENATFTHQWIAFKIFLSFKKLNK